MSSNKPRHSPYLKPFTNRPDAFTVRRSKRGRIVGAVMLQPGGWRFWVDGLKSLEVYPNRDEAAAALLAHVSPEES